MRQTNRPSNARRYDRTDATDKAFGLLYSRRRDSRGFNFLLLKPPNILQATFDRRQISTRATRSLESQSLVVVGSSKNEPGEQRFLILLGLAATTYNCTSSNALSAVPRCSGGAVGSCPKSIRKEFESWMSHHGEATYPYATLTCKHVAPLASICQATTLVRTIRGVELTF